MGVGHDDQVMSPGREVCPTWAALARLERWDGNENLGMLWLTSIEQVQAGAATARQCC